MMLTDAGLLILRIVLGLIFFLHGSQKLFGWFGGHGLNGTAQFLGSLGMQPARAWAIVAALAELAGGLLIAFGLLGPAGSALVLAVMLVAIAAVHWSKGFWNANGGIEFPVVLGAIAVALALTGHGTYSLDHALGLSEVSTEVRLGALAAALLGAVACIAASRLASERGRAPAAS